ncbi:aspartic peptidase domain-containing protein [Suillus clintonianus]|uniref:aspartic peptidase domain-containing protein n=1 Tax=Suillus clintonianus TaxID=1904413 RepID=UPI001B87C219|nr:aspartic peptidase domain-containing protein [Suillus clintonianus]KAG2125315.1 aspartic peptidase domain-containing protein [Suillus clintonianus]
MFPPTSLLTTLLLALSIAASPVEVRNSPVTLPIVRKLNVSDGTINLLKRDKSYVVAIQERSFSALDRRDDSVPVTNDAAVGSYIVQVGIGRPATTYNLVVDTSSSNTWIGASTPYVKTSTSVNTGQLVSFGYGSGAFFGTEYTDAFTLSDGLIITDQSIGVSSPSMAFGFAGVDGILGLGPVALTEGTLNNQPVTQIPTVTENLYNQNIISQNVVGISFDPITSLTGTNGELTFGGTNPAKYTGSIAYTPITATFPATFYAGINGSITYGTTTLLSAAGIVNTRTALIYVATDVFTEYQSATCSTLDEATGLLRITSTQYSALKNLNFEIGSSTYALTPNGQIWPRSLNTYIGGSSSAIYLIINDIGLPSGQGIDFILGYTFLERFYSVFDTTNSRVGFATTKYTNATTN